MTDDPLVTVVVPVHNRQAELRRALQSIAVQTLGDFECLVVDDASTLPVKPIVEEFDERFLYLRSPHNVGPTAIRRLAMQSMRGRYLIGLDSDDEFYPWGMERACHYIEDHPQVDAVCGLYVHPDGLRLRVIDGVRLVSPDDYVRGVPRIQGDVVGMFRRSVVAHWLGTRPDYYRLEFRHWLELGLRHSQLYVDEPWAKVHLDASDRVTHRTDERIFGDAEIFVEECEPWLGTDPCVPLDDYLLRTWLTLRRHRRPEERVVRSWLDRRGLSRRGIVARRAWEKLKEPLVQRPLSI